MQMRNWEKRRTNTVFSRVLRDSTPRFVRPSVGRLVGRSVGRSVGPHFTFLFVLLFWPHRSCPNGLVTSNTAPAHPHGSCPPARDFGSRVSGLVLSAPGSMIVNSWYFCISLVVSCNLENVLKAFLPSIQKSTIHACSQYFPASDW